MRRVGEITEEERLSYLKEVEAREYRHVTSDGDFYCQRGSQIGPYHARVVKLQPKGWLHPHQDVGTNRHIVLQTNDMAVCYWNKTPYWLKERGIYEFDASIEHYATNDGETDRIHLITTL